MAPHPYMGIEHDSNQGYDAGVIEGPNYDPQEATERARWKRESDSQEEARIRGRQLIHEPESTALPGGG
jgi:hypothetical protein